jgi:hypothetical protein
MQRIAKNLGIGNLLPQSIPSKISRDLLAQKARFATAQNAAKRASWNLFAIQLQSNTFGTRADLETAEKQAVAGLFILPPPESSVFSEYAAAVQTADHGRHPIWPGFATPSWRSLEENSLNWQHPGTAERIQQVAFMGDLLDIVLVAALAGGLHQDTKLVAATIQGSLIERLQISQPPCKSDNARELFERIREVRHIRPSSYKAVRRWAKAIRSGSKEAPSQAHTKSQDDEAVLKLDEILFRKCRNGTLAQDLDLEPLMTVSSKETTSPKC